MGLMRKQKLEDEYAEILEDLGLVVEENKEESEEENKDYENKQ